MADRGPERGRRVRQLSEDLPTASTTPEVLTVVGGFTYPPPQACGLGRVAKWLREKYPSFGRAGGAPACVGVRVLGRGGWPHAADGSFQRLTKALKIALAILALTLAACATPTSLMRSSPNLSGRLPGEHGALARCALHALEDYYATAWSYDLREFPREDRTQVIVRVFGTDTVLVAEFRQASVGQVDVMLWQNWGIIYDPKSVAWDGARTCGK